MKLIAHFYRDGSISRVMPRKNNALSVPDNNSTNMKKRKTPTWWHLRSPNKVSWVASRKFHWGKQIFWVTATIGDSSNQTTPRSMQVCIPKKCWYGFGSSSKQNQSRAFEDHKLSEDIKCWFNIERNLM